MTIGLAIAETASIGGRYAAQGRSRLSILVSVESAYATF